MFHKPIQIQDLCLYFPHKICFENFSSIITCGSKIAVMGRNGVGKTTLLKIINEEYEPESGNVLMPKDVITSYIPQTINDFAEASGGEKFNKSLTKALSFEPNVLLLDEPTNHLDRNNRNSLMRMIKTFSGTAIIVSHDVELLRNCIDVIWHIDNGKIHIFTGNYDDYIRENNIKNSKLERELYLLNREQKDIHQALMKEQNRASKSKSNGKKKLKQGKWSKLVGNAKASQGENTSGLRKLNIANKKQEVLEKKTDIYVPEVITPKFYLKSENVKNKDILSIIDGSIAYDSNVIVKNINLAVNGISKIALKGANGSGKSSIIKAILNNHNIIKKGNWQLPNLADIGYLDQHYNTLSENKSAFDIIYEASANWTQTDIRKHLNDFLFRKNEEVNNKVKFLSGGEKARLSLAAMAVNMPNFLILDEVTNNLDLETRNHIIDVIKAYPGAVLVVSHDEDFLKEIGINESYSIEEGKLQRKAFKNNNF